MEHANRDWWGNSALDVPEDVNNREIAAMLRDHMLREEGRYANVLAAFPDNDPAGRCRYHALVIAREERRAALAKAVIEKTFAGIIWAALAWAAVHLWNLARNHIHLT